VVGTDVPAAGAGNVYVLDPTGKIVQTLPMSGKVQVYGSPISAGNLVLVPLSNSDSSGPIMLALDQTGTIKWSFIPPK
jgi:outer membrane protein assembly factor BamB